MAEGKRRSESKRLFRKASKGRRKSEVIEKPKFRRTFILGVAMMLIGSTGFVGGVLYLRAPVLPQAAAIAAYEMEDARLCEPFTHVEVTCEVKWEQNDKAVGELVEQAPLSGERSSTVVITYSKGPSSVNMPIIAGLKRDEVQKILWSNGLRLGEVEESESSAPEGTVTESSVTPSSLVESGSAVDITVSNGLLKVPDWRGKTRELVETEATTLGINVTFVEKKSEKPANIILAQSSLDEKVENTQEVKLTVAKKDNTKDVEVPNVIGKSQDEAVSLLASAGFTKIKTKIIIDSKAKGAKVTKVTPNVDSSVDSGTEILLEVKKSN